MSVIITVRGESRREVEPEQVQVLLSAQAESGHKSEASDRAVAAAGRIRDSLIVLEDGGQVASWSSHQVRTHRNQHWKGESEHVTEVAVIDFVAVFAEVGALSSWATDVLGWDDVQLHQLSWQITEATRRRLEQEVATEAITVATQRATAYAHALGHTTVKPVEIADTGLLSASSSPEMGMAMHSRMAMAGDGVRLDPEPVTVTATVEARFTTD